MPQVPLSRLRLGDEFIANGYALYLVSKDGDDGYTFVACPTKPMYYFVPDETVTVSDELFAEIERRERENEHT